MPGCFYARMEGMEMKITKDMLPRVASDIIAKAHAKVTSGATVIALSGDLGAGKTTLTQSIAKALSITEAVISPTFVIMKRYEITDQKFTQLIHIDAYRLKDSSELMKLGWEEIVSDKKNLILIEWPENVPECIPDTAIRIHLAHKDEDTRTIEIGD